MKAPAREIVLGIEAREAASYVVALALTLDCTHPKRFPENDLISWFAARGTSL